MITYLEASNFCCLQRIGQPLGRFHALIGPNASGKTTFLDAVAFLSHLVSRGLEEAVAERTQNFHDLVWGRVGDMFELAMELPLPADLRELHAETFNTVRYTATPGLDPRTGEIGLRREVLTLNPGSRPVIHKSPDGNDVFQPEIPNGNGATTFRLGPRQSALANLPYDTTQFPVATWLKDVLRSGLVPLTLNSLRLRQASPPGRGRHHLLPDGSNLPWLVAELEHHPERLGQWLAHLRTVLPDLEGIRAVERPDDRHCYLILRFAGGLEVPSWRTSDGTLRLLALTLLAYLPEPPGVSLIEEPENGVHPQAVAAVVQSLSSIYEAQVLVATHSPVVLSLLEPSQLLCFSKNATGATELVLGSEHPMLEDWHQEPELVG